MTLHVHQLSGCAPTPLAHYLKALGILRLIATQRDGGARGWWKADAFVLATKLSAEELRTFFLEEYRPSPLVAPWNGGSGFYPGDNTDGIESLATSPASRFEPYRRAIEFGRASVHGRDKSPKDEEKQALISRIRSRAPEELLQWIQAAVVLGAERLEYPALLGTGGNDGRLDFTNNQMRWLVELFEPSSGASTQLAQQTIDNALWRTTTKDLPRKRAIGQFLPGGAGGANSSSGFQGDSQFNPWDFVLAFEGALLLRVAATRRLDGTRLPQASAPFAVRGVSEGYGSASGRDDSARGEQWFPVWEMPAAFQEIGALFGEGRLVSGRKRVRDSMGAVRALSQMGASRGVKEFVRYGYIERNGQANLAVPLGRWKVETQPDVGLLEELEGWMSSIKQAASKDGAPASALNRVRMMERAAFELAARPEVSNSWCELLERVGALEQFIVQRPKWAKATALRPIPRLSPRWLERAWAQGPEMRLAAAIASQNIRHYLIPISERRSEPQFFESTSDSLRLSADLIWKGRDLTLDLAAIAWRALLRSHGTGFPLVGTLRASVADVMLFLEGRVDHQRIHDLIPALLALNWGSLPPGPWDAKERLPVWDPLHALFRFIYRAPLSEDDGVVLDPEPLRLLMAGRLSEATRRALQRVAASQLRPRFRLADGSSALARRLAAAVAIPVALDRWTVERCLVKPEPSMPHAENLES